MDNFQANKMIINTEKNIFYIHDNENNKSSVIFYKDNDFVYSEISSNTDFFDGFIRALKCAEKMNLEGFYEKEVARMAYNKSGLDIGSDLFIERNIGQLINPADPWSSKIMDSLKSYIISRFMIIKIDTERGISSYFG